MMAGPSAPDASSARATALFVAGRGSGPHDGLHRWTFDDGGWRGTHLATVTDLSALARHPSLPVVYGVSGLKQDGWIHAWEVGSDGARTLGVVGSPGGPCHVAVDPSRRILVAANYSSGTLSVQRLADDGSFVGEPWIVRLSGGSIDPERQVGPHPHHTVFHGGHLVVVDLGADLLREFDIDLDRGADVLVPVRETAVPAGTGPRNLVVLPRRWLVLSGELDSTVIMGRAGVDPDLWAVVRSTERTGPAKTRGVRNEPGDIQRSDDGRFVYLANRGYDTISTFAVEGGIPRFVGERDSGVAWPQHLLVRGSELLVAGVDSSRVMALPLVAGLPGEPHTLFECEGAGWLLPMSDQRRGELSAQPSRARASISASTRPGRRHRA